MRLRPQYPTPRKERQRGLVSSYRAGPSTRHRGSRPRRGGGRAGDPRSRRRGAAQAVPGHDRVRARTRRAHADMALTMYVAEGAGLAANQVGVSLRVFVCDCPDDDGVRHVGHIVNPVPEPLDAGDRRLLDKGEGCLSAPGAVMDVPPARILPGVRGGEVLRPVPGTRDRPLESSPSRSREIGDSWLGLAASQRSNRFSTIDTSRVETRPVRHGKAGRYMCWRGSRSARCTRLVLATHGIQRARPRAPGPVLHHAFGATLLRPLMIRSIASPPVGSVRLASIFRVNFISKGCVRPRSAAIFMTFGLPMSFTKARPSV